MACGDRAPSSDPPLRPAGGSRLGPAVGAVAILGLTIGLRAAAVDAPLSHDEGYSWLVASAPSWATFLERLAAYENTPPLFYLLTSALPLSSSLGLRLMAFLPGVLAVIALGCALRRGPGWSIGVRAGLVGALALAVAPYEVSFSGYARAFVLAQLGVVVALWSALELARGGRRRWWLMWTIGGMLAVWAEYVAALELTALAVALLIVIDRERRREACAMVALPLLTLVAWLPEAIRGLGELGVTKALPVYPGPSLAQLRDVVATLAFGEHGVGSTGVRGLQALAIAGVLAACVGLARRRASLRRGSTLLALALVFSLVLHAVAAAVGPDVFAQRYMTGLLPLGAGILALGVASLPRPGVVAAAALLCACGVAVAIQRSRTTYEPSFASVKRIVARVHPARIRTNSAVAMWELRGQPVVLDRPMGLGAGESSACPSPCLVIEDARVASSPRPVRGHRTTLGPWVIAQPIR